jgi:rod shape-determining protein MreC
MHKLLQFLLRSGAFFLFIGLELICFSLIVNRNPRQQQLYFQYSSAITGGLSAHVESVVDYWQLRSLNDSLLAENTRLRQQLYQRLAVRMEDAHEIPYDVVGARVIKNSVNGRNNYIVLDKGSRAGVRRGMGVLHEDGPVGIVIATSPQFSKVLSLLHSESMVSTAIQRNNYFGSLVWRSTNPELMRMEAVPKHAPIQVGDTVVTSGQSAVFPRGVVLGVIDTFWVDRGSSFYSIDVNMNLDFGRLDQVYVLNYTLAAELDSLDTTQ